MNDLSVPQLASLHQPLFTAQVKKALRDDEGWLVLLDPMLIERTRETLIGMVSSLDAQIERYDGTDPQWLRAVNSLKRFAKARLDAMPISMVPITSGNREARAWRALCATLADALESEDYLAIDRLHTPYGGLTVRQWLINRKEKQAS